MYFDQVCEFLSGYYVRLNQSILRWADYHRTGMGLTEITSWLLGRRSFCKAVKDTAQQKLTLSCCGNGCIGFVADNGLRQISKVYTGIAAAGQGRSGKIGLVTDWRPVG